MMILLKTKKTAFETSSGVPIRPTWHIFGHIFLSFSGSIVLSISVSTKPGATQLIVIFLDATSCARVREKPSLADFEAT